MIGLVPSYMPWRLFWIYFVGVALIVASLSIATRIQVRWSGLLFGIMMFETLVFCVPRCHAVLCCVLKTTKKGVNQRGKTNTGLGL